MNISMRNGSILIATVAAAFAFALPVTTNAQVAAVQTRQILPPNGNACAPLSVSNVTPYITGGELNSFDVTVSNASYVALLGTIGNSPIGFQYMTRRIASNGQLVIHVDVPKEFSRNGAITLTLLSSQGASVTCMSTISFGITGFQTGTNSGTGTGSGSGTGTGTTGSTTVPKPVTGGSTSKPTATSSTTTVVGGTPVVGGLSKSLNNACASTGAMQLWLILLALFVIAAVVVGLNERELSARSPYLPAALILTPLVLLLGFWLLASDCRGSAWIPVVLLLIGAAGLVAAFRNHKTIARIIELPPAKSK